VKQESTGFSLRVDLARLVLYIALGVLGWLGQAPWWAMPALLLYDNSWILVYHSPKRLRELKKLQELYNAQISNYARVVMPGTEVDQ
jgi:hypothetical protein